MNVITRLGRISHKDFASGFPIQSWDFPWGFSMKEFRVGFLMGIDTWDLMVDNMGIDRPGKLT